MLQGELVSLSFLDFRGCLPSLVCGSKSLLPLFLLSLTLTFLPPSYKDSCEYMGPICIIQDSLPFSRSLTYSHLKSHFCVRWCVHKSWGLGCRHLWGPIFCYHINSNLNKKRKATSVSEHHTMPLSLSLFLGFVSLCIGLFIRQDLPTKWKKKKSHWQAR